MGNLTFQGAHGGGEGESVVEINGQNGWAGNAIIENVSIRDNESRDRSLYVGTFGRVFIRNAEIVGNRCSTLGFGTIVSVNAGTPASLGTYLVFNNNTVTDNLVDAAGYVASLGTQGGDKRIANNVFWNEFGFDLYIGENSYFYHNDIGTSQGFAPVEDVGRLSVSPGFAVNNYRLLASSPLRNAGIRVLDGGAPIPGGVGITDVEGWMRVAEEAVDIGAHEFDAIFTYDFE